MITLQMSTYRESPVEYIVIMTQNVGGYKYLRLKSFVEHIFSMMFNLCCRTKILCWTYYDFDMKPVL